MSSTEFDGVDLIMGSVRGFRSWRVDYEGKLTGVTHQDLWLPGENVAECHANQPQSGFPKKEEGESYAEWYERVDYHAENAKWKKDHGIADCAHGFYSFFAKDQYDGYGGSIVLNGVIEAFGEVVIGTKGVRASKARILAVAVEPYQGIWNLDPSVIERLKANYPSVAFFGSSLAMLAEFPLTRASEWELESAK